MEADFRTHVIRDASTPPLTRGRIASHRGLGMREVVDVEGFGVTSLADTWVDMGELIGLGKPVGLDDLIIMGDAIATRLGSAQPLLDALDRRVRPRGKVTLLEAHEMVRVGSLSPGETKSRLIFVRGGLVEPELNQPIYAADGTYLGRPDLRNARARVAWEYQGRKYHSSPEARAADALRFGGFEREGWKVEPIWADDVNSDEARVALLYRAADLIGFPRSALTPGRCHPIFFSSRMVELHEIRRRRAKAARLATRPRR